MKRSTIALRLSLMSVFSVSAIQAITYNFQDVTYPTDPTLTQLLGINNSGTIAGFHGAATAQGFTLTLPNTFTTQNFPASTQTMVTAINNAGSTAGIYVDAGGTTHGYTYIGGTFATVDQPGTLFNQALGINTGNTTVGYSSATDPAGQVGQVAYKQVGGLFTNIPLPANQNSQAVGINTNGDIVGFYLPTTTTSIGFEDKGGVITTIDPFGSTFTQALGINSSGEIVGFYTDAGGTQHGYIDINGLFETIDPVGSTNTTVNGINDQGQIVGFFTDVNDNTIGFVGTVAPEPTVLGLLGVGLLVGGLARRRR